MKNKKSLYEDLQNKIRELKTPAIEIWDNKWPEREYAVELNTHECTCICPKTGLPDFVTLKITYAPAKTCIELKSFKLYLVSYRDVGIFHEHLTNKILDDIVDACHPRWAKVEAIVSPRGGIQTTVTAEFKNRR
ncbi:MAG: NADPH-dependent 7-cyano-7-deazaguanine reductase QueF [Candidatus Omnitrophica bacterium]|nr:NADPH-dependent 7-cyano-7-deazaguanine reductase QueF [Candidatus Omnitrophota bacterium]